MSDPHAPRPDAAAAGAERPRPPAGASRWQRRRRRHLLLAAALALGLLALAAGSYLLGYGHGLARGQRLTGALARLEGRDLGLDEETAARLDQELASTTRNLGAYAETLAALEGPEKREEVRRRLQTLRRLEEGGEVELDEALGLLRGLTRDLRRAGRAGGPPDAEEPPDAGEAAELQALLELLGQATPGEAGRQDAAGETTTDSPPDAAPDSMDDW